MRQNLGLCLHYPEHCPGNSQSQRCSQHTTPQFPVPRSLLFALFNPCLTNSCLTPSMSGPLPPRNFVPLSTQGRSLVYSLQLLHSHGNPPIHTLFPILVWCRPKASPSPSPVLETRPGALSSSSTTLDSLLTAVAGRVYLEIQGFMDAQLA